MTPPPAVRGVRKRSARTLFGLPLYDIAMGPDPDKGEARGHACGILAIGDSARGVVARSFSPAGEPPAAGAAICPPATIAGLPLP